MAKFDVVFEGGGAKGAVFVGALEVLSAAGHQTNRLVGTSAGAITAAMCAAGYTPAQLLELVAETAVDSKGRTVPRFQTFMDVAGPGDFTPEVERASVTYKALDTIPLLPDFIEGGILHALLADRNYARLFTFVETGGFYLGAAFREWLEEKLEKAGVPRGTTLAGLAALKGADLSVTASDTSGGRLLVLNHRTAPDVPLDWAVRMSMSIPFVWQEVVWRKEWGLYLKEDITGHVIVDGGMLSNFPLRLVHDATDSVAELMNPPGGSGGEALGLLIDESSDVPGEPSEDTRHGRISSFKVIQRLSRLIDTMTGARDTEDMRRLDRFICKLPAKGYGTLEFGMQGERLEHLLEGGRDAMRTHLLARGLAAGPAAAGR
jgi:predicted acylesterase/phospholipase RssA